MAALTIQDLGETIEAQLRLKADEHGLSMEAEALHILAAALTPSQPSGLDLYRRIRGRFAPLGYAEFEPPPREPARDPPTFE